MPPKNYGLDPQPLIIGDNWIAGTERSIATLKGARQVLQADHNWRPFCPTGEEQYNTVLDVAACVSFAFENGIEVMKRRLYGTTENYSDRFLAVASETKPSGNDPHKVAETIRNLGLALEQDCPFAPELTTWEKFYAPLSRAVYNLALLFKDEFDFNHEYIAATPSSIKEHLTYCPVPAALYAYQRDEQGLYFAPPGAKQNHYVLIVDYVDGQYWWIYDSYDVEQKGEFFKKVRWDMPFVLAKSFTLNRQIVNETAWTRFLALIRSLLFV